MPALPHLLLALLLQTPTTDLPVLRPGDEVEGTIEATDPVIRTASLDELTDEAVRGKTYRIERSEPGPFHIELRSALFDSYLVLRGMDGKPLLEDDDGLFNEHSRIVVDASAEGPFLVDACAFFGEVGAFHLSVQPGEPATWSHAERQRLMIADARESVEVRERIRGTDHPDTAASLNTLAVLLYQQGAYNEARPLFERALRIWEAALGPDHPATAGTLNNLATLLMTQGAYEEAQPLHERVLRIWEAVLGPDHPDTTYSLNNLAVVLEFQGAYDEARPLYERALRIREAALGPDHPDTANSLNNLAGLLLAQGASDEARSLFERAIRIKEATLGPDHPHTAGSLQYLAELLRAQGAYDEARPLFERALRITEAALGPDHRETASSLSSLAGLLQAQGLYDEARPLFERAIRISEAALGPEHPSTANRLNNLALLLYEQGAYDEARPLYERALRITEAVLGPDHPETASRLNNLAASLMAQGLSSEARPLFEQALGITEAALGPDHRTTATRLNNLAVLLRRQGAYEEARSLFERAITIAEAVVGPDHPMTVTSLNQLTLLEFDLGQEERAFLRAKAALAGSAAHLEQVLWSQSETERLRFIRAQEAHLQLLLSLARKADADTGRRVGYEAVLGWKGQVARSLVRDGLREIRSLPQEQRVIVERLRAVQTRLSDTAYAQDVADPGEQTARLKKLQALRNALEVDLARLRGRGEAADERKEAARLAALAAALPASAAAVDFFVHSWYEPAAWNGKELVRKGRWTRPHLSAWVVRHGAPLAQHDLGEATVVKSAVSAFLEQLVRHRAGDPLASRGAPLAMEEDATGSSAANDDLRALLWEPLAAAIGDARSVFISADSFLGSLPFETLKQDDGTFLIEHHAFTYLADMHSLPAALAPAAQPDPRLFAAGGIDYRQRGALAGPEGALTFADTRASFSRSWPALLGTGAEVRAIADLHRQRVDDDAQRSVVTGQDATEERIKQSLAGCTHVHLATHGYFHPEGLPSAWKNIREEDDLAEKLLHDAEQQMVGLLPGLLSGLVFAGANAEPEPGRDNGLLTAEEITYLDLRDCDLVVLSACETGLGRAEGGEGVIGLRRAFRMAGARTVISSLWEVDDAATFTLMTLFYENLWLEGQGKQEALRNAQLTLLELNRERHGDALPSTWGAFVLDGAPE